MKKKKKEKYIESLSDGLLDLYAKGFFEKFKNDIPLFIREQRKRKLNKLNKL